ncbi:MAG TPA: cytochrome c biogenesis protein CcsA [Xanthomonadales bacterium]|nr:cytochrome c biogenesis protein CcsA [Xanthomonadales bacterium]
MYHDLSLMIAIGLYLLASAFLYCWTGTQRRSWRKLAIVCTFAGAGFHALGFWHHWSQPGPADVSLLSLMSLCALVIVLLLCISAFTRESLLDAGLVALPVAILILLVELLVPTQAIPLEHASAGTSVHIISSILAFGFLSIASVYALFAALIDHFLRSHHLNSLVRSLPPLEVLERLLFRLIAAGFLLLTVSLLSGLAYVSDLFAQHLVHKTSLSILAWLVFGLLLFGRWRYGWRGRKAVRLCLAGTGLLLLSYFGSKLVLENLLGRSWQL